MPRTVRANPADCPALHRGPSDKTHTEPTEATREKRTIREDRADRPLLKLGPSANQLQQKPKAKPDRNEMKQEHEEHRDELERRGLSAWSSRTVRQVRTE
jgi:hypothetical protein